MLSLHDGMGSGWDGKFFRRRRRRRRRRPPKCVFSGKRFPSRKGRIWEISARYYRHSDRTDAAVLFLDSEKNENPSKNVEQNVAGTFLGLKKTHMLETSYARNPIYF